MDINEIMAGERPASAVINDLKKKSVVVPSWSDLEKEYDQKKHPVMDRSLYPDIPSKGKRKGEKVTRITRGWQKLATKRMSGLMFGIPVQRVYSPQNEQEQEVAELMEAIFAANRIDSVNRERAKMLYAACEIVTIWYAQNAPTAYAGRQSALKLRCATYTPMKGASLYPLFDEYNDLIALSVEYSRTEQGKTINYFETYTAEEHVRWIQAGGGWMVDFQEAISIGKISGVYLKRDEPIWEDESDNVYEAEWALSRNGNYLRKNARPNWVVFSDEDVKAGIDINKDNDGTAFFHYPANAKAGYETWNQAYDALKFHVDTIKQNFFMQLQLPDISYENMKSAPMSGESRKMMFLDAQQKVMDESGIWEEAFQREVNVVRAHMKNMFGGLDAAIDNLKVEIVITPFQINDNAEKVSNLSNATGGKQIMSQRTAIQQLGVVDNVDEELEQIKQEEEAAVNNLFQEPTI